MAPNVGETGDAFTPLSVEEARALMTEAPGVDRDTLLAERAEAEAQLRAAEATLGLSPTTPNGETAAEQEPDEAAQKTQDVDALNEATTLDVEELRRAATVARAADDALARAASEASGRPPSEVTELGEAESAFARAMQLRDDLPATWRRLVGALISATGMAIVVGALGWNVYWLLVPIALIAILTVDLRLAGRATREASAEAARELEVEGSEALERIRMQREQTEETEGRLTVARADRDAAYARFEELAPGRLPSEVEEVIAEHEAEATARATQAEAEAATAEAEAATAEAEAAAQAEAEAAAQADAEAATAEAEAAAQAETEEAAQAEPEPDAVAIPAATTAPEPAVEGPATASEWWFGSKEAPAPPAAAPAPVKALAERLSAEGREALARIEAQLAALERVELAKRSIEWHEANGSAGDAELRPGVGQGPHALEEPGVGAPGGAAKPPEEKP